jgi:hypothetical protein
LGCESEIEIAKCMELLGVSSIAILFNKKSGPKALYSILLYRFSLSFVKTVSIYLSD